MELRDALRLPSNALVAVVGAGGKTSFLQRLAAELALHGAFVVSTTTTAIWEPAGDVVVQADAGALLAAVERSVAAGRIVTAASARRLEQDGASGRQRMKLGGVAPDVPRRMAGLPGVGYVLVEADGARGRSIKAPAGHEPVLPLGVTHVIAVVAVDALGQPLDERVAHRPERISAVLGVAEGTVLTAAHVAALLVHADGGRKSVPASARFSVFISKVESSDHLRLARDVAARLCGTTGVDAVIIGAAQAEQPVLEIWQ